MTSLRRKSNASRRRERRGIVYGKHFNFGWLIDRARAFTMKILCYLGIPSQPFLMKRKNHKAADFGFLGRRQAGELAGSWGGIQPKKKREEGRGELSRVVLL